MEGADLDGNEWELIETAILNRFWQNNTEKLPPRVFSSLTITRF